MIGKRLAIGIAATGLLIVASLPSRAEDEYNPAALANALPQAAVSLEQGLKASTREGKPISAKYEIENDALQLSVYTVQGAQFSEVIVDHQSGAITKAEPLTDADDVKDAKEQNAAMAKATVSLEVIVSRAVEANGGYRAVNAIPTLEGGHAVATVTLMKGTEVKKVTEKLD